MASPGQLVEALSKVTGIPIATVVDIDRRLAQADLRSKGGRGLQAAQMTPLDAARLLTAILAAPQANAAASAVQRYALTEVDEKNSGEELFWPTGISELTSLSPKHSFVEGLSSLISSLSSGGLKAVTKKYREGWRPHIEVFALTARTRAGIRIGYLPNGHTGSAEYILPNTYVPRRVHYWSDGSPVVAQNPLSDLEQTRRMTSATIVPIAKLIGQHR